MGRTNKSEISTINEEHQIEASNFVSQEISAKSQYGHFFNIAFTLKCLRVRVIVTKANIDNDSGIRTRTEIL